MSAIRFQPITEERYFELLEALPPIEFSPRAFLVGEPYTEQTCQITGKFLPSYQACFDFGNGNFYEAHRPLTRPEFKVLDRNGNFVRIKEGYPNESKPN